MENSTRPLAVITGASMGIGLELARVFAKNNYDLLINSGTDKINEAAADLRNYGVEVESIIADLATKEGVDQLCTRVGTRKVDVLVLNAGVGVGGEFISNDFDDELNVMNLNMVYTVYLTKQILRDMVSRNDGRILFVSSVAAQMPGPYLSVYAASKAFIQSFAQAIRFEMEDLGKNVVITSLQPGPTDTEFFSRANMDDTMVGESKKDDPAKVALDGFNALMKGKDHIVGGSIMNKVQATIGKIIPERFGAKAHSQQAKPNELKH